MRLGEVIGHGGVARLCARLIAHDRLPHGILLEGLPGCGRRTLANAMAQAYLCSAPVAGDACGTCPSCRLASSGNHPDIVSTPGESDATTVTVDLVRTSVTEAVYASPLIGSRRAFILPAIERWQAGAANSLLKALEEPPAGVLIIATTAHSGAVLRTIRSRTQLHRLAPLTCADVETILLRGGIPGDEAALRAKTAQGSHRGLWDAPADIPLESLRRLALEGFRSATVAEVMAALPQRLSAEAEAAGLTLAAEHRRTVRSWLLALCQSLRLDLRRDTSPAMAERIQRILSLQQDVARNISPRLVIESIGLVETERALRRG